jgi:hypothetical protein
MAATGFTCQEASFMRFILGGALLLLFALGATAADIGPYQVTGGSYSSATQNGTLSGDGFTGSFGGGPEILAFPEVTNVPVGITSLNFCFGCGLPGTDDGVASLTVGGLNDPALAGLAQVFLLEGFQESGGVTLSQTIDVTGPGTYSSPFSLFVRVAYGPPNTTTATQFVDFTGSGTVTLVVEGNPNPLGPMEVESLNYSFTPVPLPSSIWLFASALPLGLLARKRRI